MATVRLTVHLIPGELEPGHWCDRCRLPSAVLIPVHGIHSGGVLQIGPVLGCPECQTIEEIADAARRRAAGGGCRGRDH